MNELGKHLALHAITITDKIIAAPYEEQEETTIKAFKHYWFTCEKAGMEKKEIQELMKTIYDQVLILLKHIESNQKTH